MASFDLVMDRIARIASGRHRIAEILDNPAVYPCVDEMIDDLKFQEQYFHRLQDPELLRKLREFCADYCECSRAWAQLGGRELAESADSEMYFGCWRQRAVDIIKACGYALEDGDRAEREH